MTGRNINYFKELKIRTNTELTFKKNSKFKCLTTKKNKVILFNEEMTLSAAAKVLINKIGYKWNAIQGAAYWCHNGKSLSKLYDEKIKKK